MAERDDDLRSVDRAVSRELSRRQRLNRSYWILIGVGLVVAAGLVWFANQQAREAQREREQEQAAIRDQVQAAQEEARRAQEGVEGRVADAIESEFEATLEEKAEAIKSDFVALQTGQEIEAEQSRLSEEIDAARQAMREEVTLSRLQRTAAAYRNFVADAGFDVPNSVPAFAFSDKARHTPDAVFFSRDDTADLFEKACEATGASLFRSEKGRFSAYINRRLLCRFRHTTTWTALTEEPDCSELPDLACEDATRACQARGDGATIALIGLLESFEAQRREHHLEELASEMDSNAAKLEAARLAAEEANALMLSVLARLREGDGTKSRIKTALEAEAASDPVLQRLYDDTRIP